MKKILIFLLVFGLLALCPDARAAHWEIAHVLCSFEIVEIPRFIERIRFPVGCEVIDCCPGCPGPEVIDWRIRVEDPAIRGVVLRFEGLSTEEVKRLKIQGGEIEGDGLVYVGKKEALLTGLPGDAKGRVRMATVRLLLDEAAVGKLNTLSDRDEGGDAKDLDRERGFSIEQMAGSYVVNTFRVRYSLRWCIRVPRGDQISLQNNMGGDNAVILTDYRNSAGCQDDQIFRTAGNVFIGNALTNGACNSEVSVFSDDNAMAFDTPVATWTNLSGDVHTVNLLPILTAPVSVWIARAGGLALAQNDFANANLLYNQNNAGIQFNPTYNDVSGNAAAVAAIGTDCNNAASAQASAWYTANRLNIYYTNGAFTGVNCGLDRNISYIGTTANIASLPHEIGHAYGLRPSASWGHTNNLPGFGNNNIMWGGGPAARDHFSVGQAFRLNTHTGSMLNVNGDRAGSTRACAPNVTGNLCPALSLDSLPH